MIAPAKRTLSGFVEEYLLARDVSGGYVDKLRHRIGLYISWLGADNLDAALQNDPANRWIAEVGSNGLSKRTAYDYRSSLRTIWNEAYELGYVDVPPLRLRRIKKPRPVVTAYTIDEVRRLLIYFRTLKGRHSDGNLRRDFWQAAVHVDWSCAARRADCLSLTWSQVDSKGVLQFVQDKTANPHVARLSRKAMHFARRLDSPSGHVLPWPYTLDWFSRCFRHLRDEAGINRGTFKWIRRAASSYADRRRKGDGTRLLGHRCPRVFPDHYEDRTITCQRPVEPPPL